MIHGGESESQGSRAAKVSEFGRLFLDALLDGDQRGAEIVIREAMDAEIGPRQVDDEIVAPALSLISELWHWGEISIDDERVAMEISTLALVLNRAALRVADARAQHRVMLAALVGDPHLVARRIVVELLSKAGYDVVVLGGEVPVDALATSIERHEPDVVCISSTLPSALDAILDSIDEVQRQRPRVRFVLSGRGLFGRVQSRPGVHVCRHVSEVVEGVDAMVMCACLN